MNETAPQPTETEAGQSGVFIEAIDVRSGRPYLTGIVTESGDPSLVLEQFRSYHAHDVPSVDAEFRLDLQGVEGVESIYIDTDGFEQIFDAQPKPVKYYQQWDADFWARQRAKYLRDDRQLIVTARD